MKSGIYTITNIVNNKLYVGCSINTARRLTTHKSYLRLNNHKNTHLQAAWNKYGEENFLFEILEECEERFLFPQEHYWCNLLRVHEVSYGYNLKPTNPAKLGGHSKETREKISLNRKGKAIGEKNHFYGKKHSDKTKKEMSIVRKGKYGTHFLGKKLTTEHKFKLSLAHIGQTFSEDRKKAMSIRSKNDKKVQDLFQKFAEEHQIKVIQLDKNGSFVKEHDSIKKAALFINSDNSHLRKCCVVENHHKTAKGYYWIFKNYYDEIRKEGRNYKGIYIQKNNTL